MVGILAAGGREEKDREEPQGSGDSSPICCQRLAGLASASLPRPGFKKWQILMLSLRLRKLKDQRVWGEVMRRETWRLRERFYRQLQA